jgi:hypothetical protein
MIEQRLINAIAYRKVLEEEKLCHRNAEETMGLEIAIADLGDMPTVEAKEVVYAKWELEGNDDELGCSYFCSNCHDSFDEDWFYVTGKYRHFYYCPTCGAKMSLED